MIISVHPFSLKPNTILCPFCIAAVGGKREKKKNWRAAGPA
jgi:hypothetical protein